MGLAAWVMLSPMRFRADAAILLSIMMLVSMLAAMMLVPAWIVVFKPHVLSRDRGRTGKPLQRRKAA